MIRTEINIESPQRVEVIETGEIGYVVAHNNMPVEEFLVINESKTSSAWHTP